MAWRVVTEQIRNIEMFSYRERWEHTYFTTLSDKLSKLMLPSVSSQARQKTLSDPGSLGVLEVQDFVWEDGRPFTEPLFS